MHWSRPGQTQAAALDAMEQQQSAGPGARARAALTSLSLSSSAATWWPPTRARSMATTMPSYSSAASARLVALSEILHSSSAAVGVSWCDIGQVAASLTVGRQPSKNGGEQ